MPSTRASTTQAGDRMTDTLLMLNTLYMTHVHPLLPEQIQPMSSNISALIGSSAPYLSQFTGLFKSTLSSVASVTGGENNGNTLLTVVALLTTLYLSLRVTNYIRRTIMGWVWFGIKMLLFLLVVQAGYYVNSYGWEKATRQAGWLGSIVWGMLEDMLNEKQGGQQKQPRGTRRRGQSKYN